MASRRRSTPESPFGLPQVQQSPGMAAEMMRELAPLVAEDGIDVDNLTPEDMPKLQAALDRAVQRRNTARFAPVG